VHLFHREFVSVDFVPSEIRPLYLPVSDQTADIASCRLGANHDRTHCTETLRRRMPSAPLRRYLLCSKGRAQADIVLICQTS
jgi:hypothetical protein